MSNILDKIVRAKQQELINNKIQVPLEELEECITATPNPLNFSGALMGDRVRIIGEVKKASPSKGILRSNFDPVVLATTYANNGAAAVSVLTDIHFKGTLDHMQKVKKALFPIGVPVLRKDFIFDPYQVYEARAYGADAILLIASLLTAESISELLALAHEFWIQCLVEIHNENDLKKALDAGAEIIGINNRNLNTFETDISATEQLVPHIPSGKIVVSESGIHNPKDIYELKKLRVNAALVGEALVTSKDVAAKVRELV